MKKIVIPALIAATLFLTASCVNSPGTLETYSRFNKDFEKMKSTKIHLYKLIIEGDNYDPLVEPIILDKLVMNFRNMKADVSVHEQVFLNDIDPKKIMVDPENLEDSYDYILLIFIRTKNLGFSIRSLADEKNLFMNILLMNKDGELLTSSQYSKVTSYTLSNSKKIHKDIFKALNPIKEYILTQIEVK